MLPAEDVDQLAGEIVQRGMLKVQVRLSEVEFTAEAPSGNLVIDDVEASIGMATRLEIAETGHGRLLIGARYTLRAVLRDQEGDETGPDAEDDEVDADAEDAACAWEASVEFQGQWILPNGEGLSDDHLRAFAVRVGLMTIHPYVRSKVQSLVGESGWGLFTMDVLTNVDGIFASEEPGVLDLEGIQVERPA